MVKEYVDHERGRAGKPPAAPAHVYRANPQPDWWPPGLEVRALKRRRRWGRPLLALGLLRWWQALRLAHPATRVLC